MLTAAQIAKVLGITPAMVGRLARQMGLGVLMGNTKVYSQEDLSKLRGTPAGKTERRKVLKTYPSPLAMKSNRHEFAAP